MNYESLFLPHNLALLQDWMEETGELFVYIYYPHSAGMNNSYFIDSLAQLKIIIHSQVTPEIEIFIFRHKQFEIRGEANKALLEKSLRLIPDGREYAIFAANPCSVTPSRILGGGDNHTELQNEITKLFGQNIKVGLDLIERCDDVDWVNQHPKQVLYFAVKKNLNWYEPYSINPARYEKLLLMWNQPDGK